VKSNEVEGGEFLKQQASPAKPQMKPVGDVISFSIQGSTCSVRD